VSNIAEGQGRQSTREFLNFLSIAYGSLRELETQVMIARRLKYLADRQEADILHLTGEVVRLLNGLSKALCKR
jgi:four helix bundle protein